MNTGNMIHKMGKHIINVCIFVSLILSSGYMPILISGTAHARPRHGGHRPHHNAQHNREMECTALYAFYFYVKQVARRDPETYHRKTAWNEEKLVTTFINEYGKDDRKGFERHRAFLVDILKNPGDEGNRIRLFLFCGPHLYHQAEKEFRQHTRIKGSQKAH